MKSNSDLEKQLFSIDGKSYSLYKTLCDKYSFDNYILSIDHVQGDPFATPSKVRIIINQKTANFPEFTFNKKYKKIALEDYLLRLFNKNLKNLSFKNIGSGKSGIISISKCDAEILERTAILIDKDKLEIRFNIGFPARGRSILSKELYKILFETLPQLVKHTLLYSNLNKSEIENILKLSEDQFYIRQQLKELGLVAFIANGSILPRENGVSTKPLKNALPFESPKSLEIELQLPNKGTLKGMAIKKGITLIVGGGYHGKSTLLKAIELGVYNHVHGDGREYVITDDSALKIRSEDGRFINNTDISLFINNLPNGKNTVKFSSENASGSTSQAANIIEGIESETSLLLIDEDTSATNFMIRDNIMQKLISSDKEPITPFIEIINKLYTDLSLSTILVIGSCGDYFDVADTVIQMDSYSAVDVTQKAKELSRGVFPTTKSEAPIRINFDRKLQNGLIPYSPKGVKIKSSGLDTLIINKEIIDLKSLEQIVDNEQVNSLGYLLKYIDDKIIDNSLTVQQAVNKTLIDIETHGLISISNSNYGLGTFAMPRKQELISCLNRYRSLKIIHR